MRLINHIVIHCSATPNGVAVTPEQIDLWHGQRGFNRRQIDIESARVEGVRTLRHIGYHYVVTAEGRIAPGRHINEIGAHVQGHNTASIGICMVGTDKYFLHQWLALRELVCTLAYELQHQLPEGSKFVGYRPQPALAWALLKLERVQIVGHRDLSPDKDGDGKVEPHEWLKTCPGFNVAEWLDGDMMPTKGGIFAPEAITHPDPIIRTGGAA